MIKKTTFKNLITNSKFTSILQQFNLTSNTQLLNLINDVDSLFKERVSFTTYSVLEDTYRYVTDNYLFAQDGLWDNLDIWLSSFKENDARVLYKIYENLLQYIGFYKNLLVNDGLAKTVLTHKDYNDGGSSTSISKDVNAETPQIDILDSQGNINFDEALRYVSEANKNEGTTQQQRSGDSDIEIKSTSWEEKMKNLRLLFFSELNDYISKIPVMIYNYYALETRPFTDLSVKFIENLKEVYKN